MAKRVKHYGVLIAAAVVLFLVGLGVLLFPTVNDWLSKQQQASAVTAYQAAVEQAASQQATAEGGSAEAGSEQQSTGTQQGAAAQQGQEQGASSKAAESGTSALDAEWAACEAYNAALQVSLADAFMGGTAAPNNDYWNRMNLAGNGMMGWLEIPKIGENLPIYHGTSEQSMQNGVGHLSGTHLPIGGTSRHSVLAGHCGSWMALMFTHLDQLTPGDQFYLHVLGRTLTYQVDQVLTVLPSELDALQVVEGEDLVTLVTCTPYGSNTHRLLVRGHRITPDSSS